MVHEVEDSIMKKRNPLNDLKSYINHISAPALIWLLLFLPVFSCSSERSHEAPAVNEKDSLPYMQSRGISTLISDSGVIRYKIVAEEWNIYNTTNPPKWTFMKGLLLENFDSTFHVDWFIQCDTAYCYDQRLWELRGRVFIRNQKGTEFSSEELFWDMDKHEMYSNMFMTIREPDDLLEGYKFRSNEQMTIYHIQNIYAETPFNEGATSATPADSVQRAAPTKTHQ